MMSIIIPSAIPSAGRATGGVPEGRRCVLSHSIAHRIIRLRHACVPVPPNGEDEGGE